MHYLVCALDGPVVFSHLKPEPGKTLVYSKPSDCLSGQEHNRAWSQIPLRQQVESKKISKKKSKRGLNQRSLGRRLFVGGGMEKEEGFQSCNTRRKGENQVKAGFSSYVIPKLLSE